MLGGLLGGLLGGAPKPKQAKTGSLSLMIADQTRTDDYIGKHGKKKKKAPGVAMESLVNNFFGCGTFFP